MRDLRLVTEEEFKKLDLKGPIPLDNNSLLYFNNGDVFIVHEAWYHEVTEKYYNIIHISGKAQTICDICIGQGVVLRTVARYCSLEVGLKSLEGQYRLPTPNDDDDHNFKCTYLTPRESHSKIFRS